MNYKVMLVLVGGLAASGCAGVPVQDIDKEKAVSVRVTAGTRYLQAGDPVRARHHLSRALELAPDSAEAHNAMALLYRYELDEEHEERHYRKAIRANRRYAPAHNNYGVFLVRQGRYREALKHFSIAAEDTSYDGRALAWENRGHVLLKLDRAAEAKDAFNRALRLNPRAPGALLAQAGIFFAEGDARLADRYFSGYQSLEGTPSAEALWLGIRIASELGQADRVSSLELALRRLYPDSPEFRAWQKWRGGEQ